MVSKFGIVQDMAIGYHPIKKTHLGLARVVFEEVKSAKDCVNNLHGKSVMGKQLNCYQDPNAVSFTKMFHELTEEKKPDPTPAPEPVSDDKPPSPKASRDPRDSRRDRRESRDYPDHSSRGSRDLRRQSSDQRDWYREEHSSSHSSRDNSKQDSFSDYDHSHRQHPQAQHKLPQQHQPPEQPIPKSSQQFDADYWQAKAQQYAANIGGPPAKGNASQDPDEQPNVQADVTEDALDGFSDGDNGEDGQEDHQVDLDTRLKMLMKDKTGAMPAFLMEELNGSESEAEEGEAKDDDEVALMASQMARHEDLKQFFPLLPDEIPLERAPSPFLTPDHYLEAHKEFLRERRVLQGKVSSL